MKVTYIAKKNSGTFVADRQYIENDKYIDNLKFDQSDSKLIYFNIKVVNDEIIELLDCDKNNDVMILIKLNYQNGNPISIEEIYWPQINNDVDIRNVDLSEYNTNRCKYIIKATQIPSKYANLLNCSMESIATQVITQIIDDNGKIKFVVKRFNKSGIDIEWIG